MQKQTKKENMRMHNKTGKEKIENINNIYSEPTKFWKRLKNLMENNIPEIT